MKTVILYIRGETIAAEVAALLTYRGDRIKLINENDLEGSKFGLSSKDKSTAVCRWNGSHINPIKY